MSVCLGVRVKDPDVKKCPFKSTTPESASRHVRACIILGVGRCTCKCFITDWLQGWFNRHIMVYDREKAGSDISDFVVSILSENLLLGRRVHDVQKSYCHRHSR